MMLNQSTLVNKIKKMVNFPLTISLQLLIITLMKNKLFVIFIVLNITNLFSQETGTNMLKLNRLKPVEYYINGNISHPLDNPYSIEIKLYDSGFYEVKISNEDNIGTAYFTFKIINTKNIEKAISGQLTEISLEDSEGNWYLDENADGTLEINTETNMATINIPIKIQNSLITYKMIWENN